MGNSAAINYQPYLAYGAPPGMQQQQPPIFQQQTLFGGQQDNREFPQSSTNAFDYPSNNTHQRNQQFQQPPSQNRYYQSNAYQSTASEGFFFA